MKKVKIDEVQIGAILAEPVYIGDVMLCKQGTPMSAHLKEFLNKFGIEEILIEAVFTEDIDKYSIRFFNRNLRDTAYATTELVKHLANLYVVLSRGVP